MKKIKYIVSLILVILAMALVGEFYVWHINSVETEYAHTTFYLS